MPNLPVGPWLFSFAMLAILLSLAAGHATAAAMVRRGHVNASPFLWWLLLAAVLGARIAYVIRWWPGYRQAPWWSVLDLRDGGGVVGAGLLALIVGALACMPRRPRLRKPLIYSLLAGLACWGLISLTMNQLRAAAHPPLPPLTLQTLDGEPVALQSLAGKPMVINLWATWCAPCRREMPMLVAAGKRLPEVNVVFVDQGESAATVRAYLEREGLAPRRVLLDAGHAMAREYNVPGYPTTLFMDASGTLRDLRVGALSAGSLHAHLQRILPNASP